MCCFRGASWLPPSPGSLCSCSSPLASAQSGMSCCWEWGRAGGSGEWWGEGVQSPPRRWGLGLSPLPCFGLPSPPCFLAFLPCLQCCLVPCPLPVTGILPQATSLPPFPTALHLLPFPALVCLVTMGSITRGSSLRAPQGKGQVGLVHRPAPKAPHAPGPALRRHSMALQWAPRDIPLPRLGPGLCLEPGAPGAPPPARATPFTHQEKGTQQAIPTRSPAAQYNNSWGKWEGPGIQREEWSGQRKNRRECEKELWMKYEKQRHQGEENSSKPKRGSSVFSSHTPGCWGKRHRRERLAWGPWSEPPGPPIAGTVQPGPLAHPGLGSSF